MNFISDWQWPMFWSSASFLAFYFAVQKPTRSFIRCGSMILYLFCTLKCVDVSPAGSAEHLQLYLSFIIGQAIHVTGILLREDQYRHKQGASGLQRLQALMYRWIDFRRTPRSPTALLTPLNTSMRFAWRQAIRIVILVIAYHYGLKLFLYALGVMKLGIWDFAPDKHGFLPSWPPSSRDLALRTLMTAQWVFGSYASLTIAHSVFAIIFVSVLRCDHPSEWSQLFGSFAEAYSLRRFWGRFWHQLHIEVAARFIPRVTIHKNRAIQSSWKAAWIFVITAVYHTMINAAWTKRNTLRSELWFWCSNYVFCLMETVIGRYMGQYFVGYDSYKRFKRFGRWLGYLWVFILLICMTPGWQYPLVYDSIAVS